MADAVAKHKQGIAAYQSASFETAISFFSEAINLSEDYAEAYHARAMCYRKLGRAREGLLDAKEVVRLRNTSHKGYLEAARLCMLAGKPDRAEKMFQEALGKLADEESDRGPTAKRARIEEELEEARNTRRRMESRPISHLPSEIFTAIIAFALDDYDSRPLPYTPPSQGTGSTSFRLNPMMAAMRVSKTWRRTIEHCPSLWRSLRLDGEKDGKNVVEKMRWWNSRSCGLPESVKDIRSTTQRRSKAPTTEAAQNDVGIVNVTLSQTQAFGEIGLREILAELLRASTPTRIRSLTVSWSERGAQQFVEAAQFTYLFSWIVTNLAGSLQTLILHTTLHLNFDFSVPRLGNTFKNLVNLEIRSNAASNSSIWVTIPSDRLPAYEGEEDWPPMTKLRRLALVNPVWRLRFKDGTVASPELLPEDCPNIEELILGRTSPLMTGKLLGLRGLKTLELNRHNALPDEVGLDPSPIANSIVDLRFIESHILSTRFLDKAIELSLTFPQLVRLNLTGCTVTQRLLDLLRTELAPNLTFLNLTSTSALALPLRLPFCERLEILILSTVFWTTTEIISSLVASAPSLSRLNLDNSAIATGELVQLITARTSSLTVADGNPSYSCGIRELNMIGTISSTGGLSTNFIEPTLIAWLKDRIRPGGFKYRAPKIDEPKTRKRKQPLAHSMLSI